MNSLLIKLEVSSIFELGEIVRTLIIRTVINIWLYDWSFLYSYEKNTVIGNGKPTKAKPTYTEALVGEGGEGGIRTPVTVLNRKTDFESVPFNLSGTSPIKIRIRILQLFFSGINKIGLESYDKKK